MAVTDSEIGQLVCSICGRPMILTGEYLQCEEALDNWLRAHGGLIPVKDVTRTERVMYVASLPVAVRAGRKRVDLGGKKASRVLYFLEGRQCVSGEDFAARRLDSDGWHVVRLSDIEDVRSRNGRRQA